MVEETDLNLSDVHLHQQISNSSVFAKLLE